MNPNFLPQDGLNGLKENWKRDMISGFLVFLIALPLCLGISMASGFPPIAGIFTAIIGGLLVGPISGSRLTIKGPAAGLIAIAAASVMTLGKGDPLLGYKYTLAVVVVAGVIQMLFGLLKMGKFGDFFPASAVHGMLAAIGIIIIAKQFPILIGVKPEVSNPLALLAAIPAMVQQLNPEIALIGLVSLVILFTLPRIKSKYVKLVPAPMLVVIIAMAMGRMFDLEHFHSYLFLDHQYFVDPKYLVTLPARLADGLTFPDFGEVFSGDSIKFIIMFALVGSLESLLTVKAIDRLDPYQRASNPNKDLLAVGAGNTLSGLIGGLPMIAEVVRSSANINNGAQTRWANFFHAAFLLIFVAFLPGLIHQIPLAALAAMLIYTGYRLASPELFRNTYKIGKEQIAVFLVTIIFTLAEDLLVGIAAGIALEIIIHLFSGARLKNLFKHRTEMTEQDGKYVIKIKDAAVFTNYLGFKKFMADIPKEKHLVFDFSESTLVDHTFMEHLHHFETDYHNSGGQIVIKGLHQMKTYSSHPMSARKMHKEGDFDKLEIKLNNRQRQLKIYADAQEMMFMPNSTVNTFKFRDFLIAKGTRILKEENMMFKYTEDGKVEISDITAQKGAFSAGENMQITVCMVSDMDAQLPDFKLEPEGLWNRIEELSGTKDIDFHHAPVFSKRYFLSGENEVAIRRFFNEETLKFLESHPAYHIECSRNRFLVYQDLQLSEIQDIDTLLLFVGQWMQLINTEMAPDNFKIEVR